jgi:hypothetical protein
MNTRTLVVLVLLACALPGSAWAGARCTSCPRDARGRILRSASARREFERETGHPHGWAGHVIDHVVPLACWGPDAPSNMQWQTRADARAKDQWETRGCTR